MDDVTWTVVALSTIFGAIVGLIHNLNSDEEWPKKNPDVKRRG